VEKKRIFSYEFVVRTLPLVGDEVLRNIFRRLNRNVVALNAQELRHATYWGPFIKSMEKISDLESWEQLGIFTANDVRRMLGLDEGVRAQRAVRVRSEDGVPFSYLTTHVPEAIGRAYGRKDLASTPLLALLERSGVVAESADQSLGARLADPTVAAHLEIDVGSPLLSLTRVVYDPARRPVEHIRALYRPDRYQYRMSLARERGSAGNLWSPPTPFPRARAKI